MKKSRKPIKKIVDKKKMCICCVNTSVCMIYNTLNHASGALNNGQDNDIFYIFAVIANVCKNYSMIPELCHEEKPLSNAINWSLKHIED